MFSLCRVVVKAPDSGYTEPLKNGIVVSSYEKPSMEDLAVFEGMKIEKFFF